MSETLHLLEKAREGDRRALTDLCARHRGRLLAYVATRLPRGVEGGIDGRFR